MQAKKTEEKRKKLAWQTAMYDASLQNGFLRLCWDEAILSVSPIIYDFQTNFGMPLKALRLIGIGLTELPEQLAPNLRDLEVLSIANNQITSLPENIASLTRLRELNVMYNKLEKLPSRIGYMCSLQKLGVANNRLELLPASFGALNLLERVDLEHNCLTVLPENLDNMISCKTLNVNNNKLVRLPRCVGSMPNLTSLSASCNSLTYIPSQLTLSTSLTCLRLNVNQISVLPDRLGDLTQLVELNLDYNKISKLPTTFWRLSALRVLRIEGNDALLDPPPEVLGRGAETVVQHFRAIHMTDKHARMREIVLAVQNVLRQIQERDLADPALFEPDVQRNEGDEKDLDRWFALQLPYLWKDLLPQLKRIWEEERRQPKRRHDKKMAQNSDDISTFDFSEREAMQALTSYADAVGPVLRYQKAKFRRCACVDSQGQRVPCVPPCIGYMCLRDCVLLKRDLVREREKHDRLWNAYKSDGMRDAIKRAEYESKLYLDSAEGQLWLEDTAYEQAEEVLVEGGANAVVEKRYQELEKQKRRIVQKYDRQKERVQKVRDQKIAQLEASLEQLKEDKRVAKEGYVRNAVEQRIQALTVKLAHLPETAQLLQIQEDCERDCALLDEGLYDSDSVNTSEVDSSDFSTDDESPEAQRWREKLERRNEGRMKKEKMKAAKQRFGVEVEVGKGVLAQVKHAVDSYVVEPVLQPVADGLSATANKVKKKVRRNLRQIVEVATIRARKLYLKTNGHFDEVQRELKYEIYRQYVDHHVQQAREKARREFAVIESVRTNMEGMGRSKAFRAWKFWVVTKKRRIRKDLRKRWKMATRGFDAAMHSVTSAQFQVDLWIKNKDIYSDRIYWRNEVNGNITYDKPGLHHYLPPNFQIPVPPVDLPEDVPLETSSSDDSQADGWLERYEERRRQKRDAQNLLNLALHSTPRTKAQAAGGSSASSSSSESESGTMQGNTASSASSAIHWDRPTVRATGQDAASAYGDFDGPAQTELLASATLSSHPEKAKDGSSKSSGSGSSNSGSSGSSGSSSSGVSGSQGSASESQSQSQSASASFTASGTASAATSLPPAPVADLAAHRPEADMAYAANEWGYGDPLQYQWAPQQGQFPESQEQPLYEGSYDDWQGQQQENQYQDPTFAQPVGAYVGTEGAGSSNRELVEVPDEAVAVTAEGTQDPNGQQAKKYSKYTFRGLMQKYNYSFDEGEEEYVGATNSAASERLLQAIEYAREYMRTNRLYLLRNQLRAVGGGKTVASSKSNKNKRGSDADIDERAAAHQAIDLYAKPSDLAAEAEVIKHKAYLEYEIAFKAIRKKRNQLNVQRHHTYMHQINRKPKSLEMHRAEVEAAKPKEGSEEELMQRVEDFVSASGKLTGEFRIPTDAELLQLAGGDKDMVLTGKAGMELRTVLAQRALHVKKRLEQQAVEKRLIRPKKSTTFWGREIRPLFMDKFRGSSSEEEEEDEERMRKKAKDARQKERREKRAERAFMSQKLGSPG